MRNFVKRTIAAISCMLLLAVPALAEDAQLLIASAPIYISVRVEGISKNLVYEAHWAVEAGSTVLDAVKSVLDARNVAYAADGTRFSAVSGEKDSRFGGWDGWVWCLGNAIQTGSMADYTVQGGESILLCYADTSGTPPTLLPYVTAARGTDGLVTLTFTAQRSSYDADWKLIYATVPVTGAAVTAGSGSYVTDAAGKVFLTAADSGLRTLPVQISSYAANGKPLVVRLTPDFTIDLSAVRYSQFTDVGNGAWYDAAVTDMSARSAVNGYADKTFRPLNPVTRAEAVAVLARLSGADLGAQPVSAFSDVSRSAWYAPYVDWAVSTGVADGMGDVFRPESPITRQDLCVMLMRYADKIMKCVLPETNAAPAFEDAADIATYAAEPIYRLQKAGVADGFGTVFLPRQSASRAQLCMLLQRMLQL